MLTDQELARMNADGLREYVRTLHRALAHVSTALVEAEQIVVQATTPTKANGVAKSSDAMEALARALAQRG